MTRIRYLVLLLVPLLGALLVAGLWILDRPGDNATYGRAQPLGNGTVRSFVTLDDDGEPLTVGLLMTASSLDNLPTHLPGPMPVQEVVVPLPERARVHPFDHISLDWNPVGHEPEGMYTQPHFDVHFYMMTEAERNAIDPMASDFEVKATHQPNAVFLPANHVLAPGTVPRMGNHWVDQASPEMNGKPFSTTFIYGSWDGKVTFLEPMITKAFIESVREMEGQIFRAAIPQPASVHLTGYYPTAYSIQYDEGGDTYAIVLEGLRRR